MKVKSKDQKSLEFLYEQVIDGEEFPLLKEEDDYFKILAKNITDTLYNGLQSFPYGSNFPHDKKITEIGFVKSFIRRDVLVKNFPKEVVNACADVFHTSVSIVTGALVVTKHDYEPEERKYFAFKQPDSYINKTLKKVDYKDKDKFEQTLNEWFIRTLAYFKSYYAEDQSFKIWSAWRTERLKFQGLIRKLPELEGIFD